MHAVPVVLKVAHTDLCSSYTSYQKPVIELGRIFIFFPSMLFSQPAKSIDLSLAQDEREKLLKIWLSSSVIPPSEYLVSLAL